MKIGELSNISTCSIQTIRFYEKEGLLSEPKRSEGNFRLYGHKALKELEFIKHCRSLDIPLVDIKLLIALKNKPDESCSDVNALIEKQLALVNQRMKELISLKNELQQMISTCGADNTIEACGIIKSLDS
ncbi:Cd(II)/Pb(II)-responsive transcriptional regulator [Algibacillus agarilyticus]|uniref:Cd(II)/Pb(II)-responsive transcriptional regulator n=1 Tax=Algibacillus agarilyticus TaxID=2234133 RepID=UPI000DD00B04|nr:Cd(II)/Pb(II)-responsive transcriptional regulator [Algibacillus agarilyticus]